ncbi:MAG: hypothetical protein J6N18_07485 [Kiritimatiellae bacterium]|nr:hypothetical protein [Kiritimatiellia bacterium]
MKKSLKVFALWALSVAFYGAAAETTNTFYVAEGETKTVDEIVTANGFTFSDGDWIRKTGKGQLNAVTTYKGVQLNLLIEEGVYFLPDSLGEAAHTGGSTIVIKSGATLNIEGEITSVIDGTTHVYFEGSGAGEGNNLGAISVGGGNLNYLIGNANACEVTMTGNAVIYGYGTWNSVFGGKRTFNMGGNELTVRGNETIFYINKDFTIKDPGPFVFANSVFLRKNGCKNTIKVNIPSLHLMEGSAIAPLNSPNIWDAVDFFEFDVGSKICDNAYKGDANAAFSIKKAKGPVAICSPRPAVVTITDEYIVRSADLADGHYLTSEKEFIFAEGCKLSVADLEDFPKMDQASVYTVAVSSVSITGVPTLTGDAVNYFDIVKEDKVLALDCRKSRINAATGWGLKTGIENAAANTAAVADNLAAVGANTEVFIPSGEYWFSETLDLSGVTAEGLMLSGSDEGTVLHSGVAIGASQNVVVRNLIFKDCEGPAVAASDTRGLTVTEYAISNVVGRYTDGKRYIYAAVNVTDFNATGNTYWFDEMALDGQGYFEGGSQSAKSEAYADAVVMRCTGIGYWSRWVDMTNTLGLAQTAFSGKTLRKIGDGTFEPTDVNMANLGISGVELLDGRYVSRSDEYLGLPGGLVRVHDGATLQMRGVAAQKRTVHVSGNGINSMGAIRFDSGDAGKKSSAVTWILDGDTTVLSKQTGENLLFSSETVHANGHVLTFSVEGSIAGVTNCMAGPVSWYGGGTVVVERSTLSSGAGQGLFTVIDGNAPQFMFKNGATYAPCNDSICALVKNCDFTVGTKIAPKAGTSVSFGDFSGLPEISDSVASLSINGAYRIKSADVLAGRYPSMSGALSFGPEAVWALDDMSMFAVGATYTLFKAEGGISRAPKTLPDDCYAAWRIHRANGGILCIGPRVGSVVVFR